MVYRPALSDENKKKIEEIKEVLREVEEQDEYTENLEQFAWRRKNGTFKLNFIFSECLKSGKKEFEEMI